MKRTIFLLAFLASTIAVAANPNRQASSSDKMVRVAIVREAREVNLQIEGPYVFRDAVSGKRVGEGQRQATSTVRLLDRGIFIGMNVYPYKKLIIEPRRESSIVINRRRFRGNVVLIRTPGNRLSVINSINIEDYIKGVLYHEVSHHWPMEALKAQAVAARAYAIYSMGNSKTKDFDVTNDIFSQVYGGQNSERYRTGLAVDRTKGQILAFNSRILPAYFHATCAGMTEDAGAMWNLDLAPLRGVPCKFCSDSPHMRWKKNFRLADIQSSLNKEGYHIDLIKDISVVQRNRSGRIERLKIISRTGQEVQIIGKDFRSLLGPNIIRSNNYDIHMKGYYVDIVGKGWGHGVGLCQWGARGMSAQGFNYKQILNYYYPGADIIDYHELPDTVKSKPASKKSPSKQSK